MLHADFIIFLGGLKYEQNILMSIRVSEEELEKLKKAARLEAYASYSEFVRRTALIESNRIIQKEENRDK